MLDKAPDWVLNALMGLSIVMVIGGLFLVFKG